MVLYGRRRQKRRAIMKVTPKDVPRATRTDFDESYSVSVGILSVLLWRGVVYLTGKGI